MIDTQFSVVSANECDGNGHLNVGNYVKLFSQAGQNFLAMNNAAMVTYRPGNRHFRFHRELEEGARLAVSSIRIAEGSEKGHLLHILRDSVKGVIAATCIDSGFGTSLDMLPQTHAGAPVKAKPRSISATPFKPVDADQLLALKLAKTAYLGRIQSVDCAEDGVMHDGEMVTRFFDAANHVWGWAGLDEAWMAREGFGMAAIEMKLTIHEPARALQDYSIVSWVPRMGAKFMPLSHQLVSSPESRPLASICANAVLLDRDKRMAVDVPASMREAHANRFDALRSLDVY